MEWSFELAPKAADEYITKGNEFVAAVGYRPAPNNPTTASRADQPFVVGGEAPDGRRAGTDDSGDRPSVWWVGACTDDPSMVELAELKRNGPESAAPTQGGDSARP